MVAQHKVQSILQCAARCRSENTCVSFDYKASIKTCFLNEVIGSLTSGDLTVDMTSVHGAAKTDAQRCY